METAVSVIDVTKRFGRSLILDDISLSIQAGELFGLLGPSGAGKTTLVRILAGLTEASSGNVLVLGEAMPCLRVLNRIGFMSQADALYNDLTAWDNMEFFASIYGLSGKAKHHRIAELLELVTLTDEIGKRVASYSGGMKRRLSLAIALLHNPELLILDEPTTGMDPVLRKSVLAELRSLQQKGTTIILTTHAMEEADKCDRLGLIRGGRLIAVGSPTDLRTQTSTTSMEDAFLAFGGAAAK